jgi:hypothetical protein
LPLELLKTTRRLNHAASRSFQQQTIYCSGSRCTGHVYYMYILYIYNACANVCTYSCIYVYIYRHTGAHILNRKTITNKYICEYILYIISYNTG